MFPASRKVANANGEVDSGNGRRFIPLELGEHLSRLFTQASGISVARPAIFKAAWALTIQCFIVTDVLCFKYSGPIDPTPRKQDRSSQSQYSQWISALYVTRLDRSETVLAFLQRLEKSQKPSATTNDPAGYDIGIFEAHSPYHECNTGVFFAEGKENRDNSRRLAGTEVRSWFNENRGLLLDSLTIP
jgi:hypothetical protein